MSIKLKKWDYIIIVILIIISFIPCVFFKGLIGEKTAQVYAYITVAGELYNEIPLTGQVSRKEFSIETKYGKNTIVIKNESIAVVASDCKDHICEDFGYKGEVGDVIVCLPHQLYIEIKSNETMSKNQDIIAY